jgi:hypothetical protein
MEDPRLQDHRLGEKARRFYRGTLFQAIVLGLTSFTQPGIWDALNSKLTLDIYVS